MGSQGGMSVEKKVLTGAMFTKKSNTFENCESVYKALSARGLIHKGWSSRLDRVESRNTVPNLLTPSEALEPIPDLPEFSLPLDLVSFMSGNTQSDPKLSSDDTVKYPALRRRRIVRGASGDPTIILDSSESLLKSAQRFTEYDPKWLHSMWKDLKRYARVVSDDRVMTPKSVLEFGERRLVWRLNEGVTFQSRRPIEVNPLRCNLHLEEPFCTEGSQNLDCKLPISLSPVLLLGDLPVEEPEFMIDPESDNALDL